LFNDIKQFCGDGLVICDALFSLNAKEANPLVADDTKSKSMEELSFINHSNLEGIESFPN